MEDHFRSIEEYPRRDNANGIVIRLIDGLGFRFYWATEGLREEDYAYAACESCQTIGGILQHLWGLANWLRLNALGEGLSEAPDAPEDRRRQVLEILAELRAFVDGLDEQRLFGLTIRDQPFWHYINGPLADALTHTGQIAYLRRASGNPAPKHNPFLAQ